MEGPHGTGDGEDGGGGEGVQAGDMAHWPLFLLEDSVLGSEPRLTVTLPRLES